MNLLSNEHFSNDMAPILLGYSDCTAEIARHLFRKYHLISHIFCKRVPLLRRFSLIMKFHPVHGFAREELLVTVLEQFSDTHTRNSDTMLFLIPTTASAIRLIRRYRDRLESRYVIANAEELRFLRNLS